MDFGNKVAQLRKDNKLSRDELGKTVGTSGAIIGRYERNEITPSVEAAAKLSRLLGVSLDYLVGNSEADVDTATLDRVLELQKLPEEERATVFKLVDAFIRDAKTKQAYAS